MLDLQIRAVSSLPIRTQFFDIMTSAIGSTSACRMNVTNTFYIFQDIEDSRIDFTIQTPPVQSREMTGFPVDKYVVGLFAVQH